MVDLSHLPDPLSLSLSLSLFPSLLFIYHTMTTTSIMGTSCPSSFFSHPHQTLPHPFFFFFFLPNWYSSEFPSPHQGHYSFKENVYLLAANWLKSAWDRVRSDVLVQCCRFRPVSRQAHVWSDIMFTQNFKKFKNVNLIQTFLCNSVWCWLNISSCYQDGFCSAKLRG